MAGTVQVRPHRLVVTTTTANRPTADTMAENCVALHFSAGAELYTIATCPENTVDHRTAFDVSCALTKCEEADFARGGACCPLPDTTEPEPEPATSG